MDINFPRVHALYSFSHVRALKFLSGPRHINPLENSCTNKAEFQRVN